MQKFKDARTSRDAFVPFARAMKELVRDDDDDDEGGVNVKRRR